MIKLSAESNILYHNCVPRLEKYFSLLNFRKDYIHEGTDRRTKYSLLSAEREPSP